MTGRNEFAEVYGTWDANPGDLPRGSSGVRSDAGEHGSYRDLNGFDHRESGRPDTPDYGLSVAQLVRYQRAFTEYAANRLRGVGAQQYDRGGKQKFEDMPVMDIVQGLREELADIVNYAVMLDVRMNRIASEWEAALYRKADSERA